MFLFYLKYRAFRECLVLSPVKYCACYYASPFVHPGTLELALRFRFKGTYCGEQRRFVGESYKLKCLFRIDKKEIARLKIYSAIYIWRFSANRNNGGVHTSGRIKNYCGRITLCTPSLRRSLKNDYYYIFIARL